MEYQQEQSKTIAVLPFVNMSSDEENEYFSDGMTEEIINALANIKELKVTSRTSSFFFKNKNIPIREIGEELNVSTILEGSIRLSGNMMRITAQLIDVTDDFHFWSETFDRSTENIFAVQDEVSVLIADKLREHIGHFELKEHLVNAPDIPTEVYKEYLRGRYYLMKMSLADNMTSVQIFKNIIKVQPDFALAYLGINQAYTYLGTMGLMSAHESFMKAAPYLNRASELNENLPEVQLNLCWNACWQNWNIEQAFKHIVKAAELRPSDEIYLTTSNLLTITENFEAAHTYIDKALQLDPISGMNVHYKGFLYYLQEQYEKAIPFFKKSILLNSDIPYPNLYWGQSMLLLGKPEEALSFFKNLPEDRSEELTKLGGMTLSFIALNDTRKTTEYMAKLEEATKTNSAGRAINFLILAHTMKGDTETALKLIEEGAKKKMPLTLLLFIEPLLKSLRSDTRFQRLQKQIFGSQTDFGLSKKKYKKPLFDPESLKKHKDRLKSLMAEKKPYLDSGLTLRGLAKELGFSPNQLSRLLNEGFDKNFSEYINSYRVEAFKAKASEPGNSHLTLLAIAYESGFNSKTVFNTFFKKTEGITPRVYWKKRFSIS